MRLHVTLSLEEGVGTVYPSKGEPYRGVISYPAVQPLQDDDIKQATSLLRGYNKALLPENRKDIATEVQKLFLIFPTKNMNVECNEIVLDVWIEFLEEYPSWSIKEACRKYIKRNKWRPTPHDILELVKREVIWVKWEKRRLEKGMK